MTFLPEGYQKPESNSKYLKFEEGDNRFRILSSAIVGYIDWTEDKKPVRTKEQMKPIVPGKMPKHFWAFVVWDYKSSSIKILEITQATIQGAIYDLHNDTNWGDPKAYDINVKRTGKDMNTEYTVIPTPPKPLHPEIEDKYKALKCDLNALYDGLDPFTTSAPENAPQANFEPLGGFQEVDTSPVDISEIPF